MMMMMMIMIISIAPYFTDKGAHTALYKINKNVCIKTCKNGKLYSHSIVFLAHHTQHCPSRCTFIVESKTLVSRP